MTRIMKFLGLLSVLFLVVSIGVAFAQEPAPVPAPTPVDYGQKLFDMAMFFIVTVAGPVITMFMKTAPSWVRYALTAVSSIVGGALTGEFTSVPFPADTMAMITGSISLALQRALHEKQPEPIKEAEQHAAAALKTS